MDRTSQSEGEAGGREDGRRLRSGGGAGTVGKRPETERSERGARGQAVTYADEKRRGWLRTPSFEPRRWIRYRPVKGGVRGAGGNLMTNFNLGVSRELVGVGDGDGLAGEGPGKGDEAI
ncbi:hypothetical protein GWI33_005557 [Rhynchophorus ferrugineus]|uniref:Uncharacterized protein n=1 Tax=Rhynchophorus ferrugineus TaxID=354439 RepID=A0A834IH66_RHYFE|nr:hypothetical protein GWI33_005557 [Rhynchophorus ferrugineus]